MKDRIAGRFAAILREVGRRRYVTVAALMLLSMMVAMPLTAQETTVQAQSEATYSFGQNMQFSLRAKSAEEIVGATLFFNTPEMERTFTVDIDVDPANEVVLAHEVALTRVQLAPFTTVRYWWRLTTNSGVIMVDEKTLSYADDRFQWQEMEAGGIEVRWTGSDRTLGQMVLDAIEESQTRLATVLPADVAPLRVYVYPSMADLRSALRLTGRDWVGAEAKPELGVLLVTVVNPRTAAFDLAQTIPHELTHLLLYRALGAQYDNLPRWFDEGLATGFEATRDASGRTLLSEAIAANETIALGALCQSFPASEAEARLAYAQSADVVEYIRQEYGAGALRALMQAYGDGADCDAGVRHALGITLQDLEADWLAQEAPESPFLRFMRLNGLWMVLFGGGFVVMFLLLLPGKREQEQISMLEDSDVV